MSLKTSHRSIFGGEELALFSSISFSYCFPCLKLHLKDQVPTLAIHEKSSLKTSSGRPSMNKVAAACAPLHGSTDMHDQDQALSNGDMESPDVRGKNIDRRDGGKTNSTHVENESFVFATEVR
uniref:Uncharacterized protein n=1 Tax=Salix viminalis TaxID=40686 RepID=A0A6N2NBC5_SALVM